MIVILPGTVSITLARYSGLIRDVTRQETQESGFRRPGELKTSGSNGRQDVPKCTRMYQNVGLGRNVPPVMKTGSSALYYSPSESCRVRSARAGRDSTRQD
jgi:hypothetical protein